MNILANKIFSRAELIQLLEQVSDDERVNIFSRFCTFCGSTNPACRCWDDD